MNTAKFWLEYLENSITTDFFKKLYHFYLIPLDAIVIN